MIKKKTILYTNKMTKKDINKPKIKEGKIYIKNKNIIYSTFLFRSSINVKGNLASR